MKLSLFTRYPPPCSPLFLPFHQGSGGAPPRRLLMCTERDLIGFCASAQTAFPFHQRISSPARLPFLNVNVVVDVVRVTHTGGSSPPLLMIPSLSFFFLVFDYVHTHTHMRIGWGRGVLGSVPPEGFQEEEERSFNLTKLCS